MVHQSKTFEASWLWAGGAALIVFAARCREIHVYASDTPYLDQWWVEATQVLLPWLQGKLSVVDFFRPHHEHIPAWSRLLAWLEAVCLGRWDPQLQCTVNAALFGAAVGAGAEWLRRTLPLLPALLLSLVLVVLYSLPHGWENSTWGFQSHTPLALLFVGWYIHGSLARPPFTAAWWFAQGGGLAAFFTFGTMWAAPAAVLVTVFWTAAPDRRRWISAAILTVIGLALMLAARSVQEHSGAFSLTADSPQQFLAALLLQLGWPSQWSGAAILVYLPALLLALQLRRNPAADAVDRCCLALALWAAVQATAFAYGRGSYLGFVSRYGDLLALGLFANALAWWRLLHSQRSWRPLLILLTAGWIAGVTQGLNWVSTRAHTEYFHEHAAVWALLRRQAVQHYLATKDATPLKTETLRTILYPDPAVVTAVLDQPGLAPLLPVSLRADGIRARGDFISAANRVLQSQWSALGACGITLLLLGAALTLRQPRSHAPASPGTFANRPGLWLTASLCALTGALILSWPMPFEFRSNQRWKHMLKPPGVISELNFQITTPTTFPGDRLTGAAALWPEDFRNTFYGTHLDGPSFTGRAQSSPFPINSPWLVVPYAGFPVSAGNGLRLQIEDRAGHVLTEISCPGPNPSDINFWSVDVRSYAGQQARLVFYDGRTDAEGWVAAAPPQPAANADLASRLSRSWKLERTTLGHGSLAVIFVALLCVTLILIFASRSVPPQPPLQPVQP